MRTNLFRSLAFASLICLFVSCQKEVKEVIGGGGTPVTPPDLSTKVSSSISGFVTDKNNNPIENAQVKAGTVNVSTDEYGFFEIKDVQVVKNAATVTIIKAGYFTGFKTYTATAGKASFFRIKLIPISSAGTINAATGGAVTLTGGFRVSLPANAVLNAATLAPYTGTITVNTHWIDPTGNDVAAIMPGDLRGLDTSGAMRFLASFGMAAVELNGSSGEKLQIAAGKRATLTFPIPSSILSKAPATIPLWYFDETKGLWKEEGSASKSGSSYTGDVNHFTLWNVDDPEDFVRFSCTIVNPNGQPVPYVYVKVTDGYFYSYSYTDSAGYTSGYAPVNQQLTLQVFDNSGCSTPVFSHPFTTTTQDISLGTLTIPSSSNRIATISGTVKNCNGTAVTSGYVMLTEGSMITRYMLSSTGTYSISKVFCSIPSTITLIGADAAAAQESNPVDFIVTTAGQNNVPDITACGQVTQEYFNFTDNGTPYAYAAPIDSLYWFATPSPGSTATIYARTLPLSPTNYATITFGNQGVTVGSTQNISTFSTFPSNSFMLNSGTVNITEYGAVGQFVSGTFTAVKNDLQTGTQHTYNGSFRVRRAN